MTSTHIPREVEIAELMQTLGIDRKQAEISWDRRQVYGDPFVNHTGIGMAWAGLLQPWAHYIAQMIPVPPHVVALCMAAVKLNRQRVKFHADNYDDMAVYQAFARLWQAQSKDVPFILGPKPEGGQLEIGWRMPGENYDLEPPPGQETNAANLLRYLARHGWRVDGSGAISGDDGVVFARIVGVR